MKIIILEHPRLPSEQHFNDIANTPLWSCLMGGYAAVALLADGHAVRYLDAVQLQWGFDDTQQQILAEAPDLLAVNAVYFWEQTPVLFRFLSQLRKEGFDGHINLFGFFPTLAFDALLDSIQTVNSVTVGECEHTLCDLARALARAGFSDGILDGIPGLAIRTTGSGIKHAVRPPEEDPDLFPFPVRAHGPEQTAGILASRGCYNHCSFCPVPPFYNGGALWRGRSPANIIREVRMLKEQEFEEFYFLDPNFVGPGKKGRQRAMELAGLLAPLKIRFGMETRPNDLTRELIEALRKAGLTSLLLGIESASSSMLTSIGKSSSVTTAERAIELCRGAGIEPEIGFLMFLPDSRLEDIRRNYEFLQRNNLLDRLDRTLNMLSHRHIVLKGTRGFREFKRMGRLTPTGALGFEGIVSYGDPGTAWLAHEVTDLCSAVLREMSIPDSALYWGNGPCDAWQAKNDAVVVAFERMLDRAANGRNP